MTEREIDTQSNLSSEVLEELLERLGLDGSPLVTKHHFIDFSLLKPRNSIAHGEYLDFSSEAYIDAHDEVLGLLNMVRNIVSNAASNGAYRRA
jgi:hypothetical protein